MSAILLGILIAGAIIFVALIAVMLFLAASRDSDSANPAVTPPPSSWGSIDPAAPASIPIAPSQPMAESSSPSMLVGKIIRNLGGPNLEAITMLSQLSTQVEMENQGKNLTRAERQQALIKALDDLAARDPGNEMVQKLRDSISRAVDASGESPAVVTISEPPVITFTNGSGAAVQSTVLGKLFEHLGSEMDAAGALSQYASQVQAGSEGKNLNMEENLRNALKALDEAAARNPDNPAIQKMRESLQKAIDNQARSGQ